MSGLRAAFFAMTFIVSAPGMGHHSEAAFDVKVVVAFQGTVTRFGWRNPHVYIYVETTDAAGERGEWEIETGSTPILTRSGWTPRSLIPGETVAVRAHPKRNTDRKYALLLTIEKENGAVLSQKSAEPQTLASAADLSGVWKGRDSMIEAFFERFNNQALTEKAAAAKAQYDPRTDNPAAQCIPLPPPRWLVGTGLYLSKIELREDRVIIRNELYDVERTVHMDGRGHPDNGERTNQGHSIGSWQDDVLVVDTRLFEAHRSAYGEGVPSGEQKHLIERYALSDDGTRLMIDVLLEDPEYLAEPFTGTLEWNYTPDLELFRYNCELEISRRFTLD